MPTRLPIALVSLMLLANVSTIDIAAAAVTKASPGGSDVDTSTIVAMLPAVPEPCISIAFDDVVAVIAREPIEARAADARLTWETEDARLALIAAIRARELLAALQPGRDAFGCARIMRAHLGDSEFLVAGILESGQAAVFANGWAVRGEPSITVRHVGSRCGPTCGSGHALFQLHDRRAPFFSVLSWIA